MNQQSIPSWALARASEIVQNHAPDHYNRSGLEVAIAQALAEVHEDAQSGGLPPRRFDGNRSSRWRSQWWLRR